MTKIGNIIISIVFVLLTCILAFFFLHQNETNKQTNSHKTETIETLSFDEIKSECPLELEKNITVSKDFITGVDVSSVISLEESGVKFYSESGKEQDIFKTLKESGINCIRIRIFNDPYDKDGNTYGGGHNDLATAIAIGKRATAYQMKVMIDFHYSDFFADPKKQQAPKSFKDMSLSEKKDAIYNFTKESIEELLKAGIDLSFVQIGNETNNAMCGETGLENVCILMNEGSRAVREASSNFSKNIMIALHFTDPHIDKNYSIIASNLLANNVDYDIFASSYYPYFHGNLDNLVKVLSNVAITYDKYVLVVETSYPYTFDDSDYFANTIGESNKADLIYDISPQGQADYLFDLISSISSIGDNCLGMLYWEPAWITVGNNYSANKAIWEQYGSGWATSYAGSYDSKDAGKYFGGSSWDNQALFDKSGHPLPSLCIFRYLGRN